VLGRLGRRSRMVDHATGTISGSPSDTANRLVYKTDL
jgi:hypothetical protein